MLFSKPWIPKVIVLNHSLFLCRLSHCFTRSCVWFQLIDSARFGGNSSSFVTKWAVCMQVTKHWSHTKRPALTLTWSCCCTTLNMVRKRLLKPHNSTEWTWSTKPPALFLPNLPDSYPGGRSKSLCDHPKQSQGLGREFCCFATGCVCRCCTRNRQYPFHGNLEDKPWFSGCRMVRWDREKL